MGMRAVWWFDTEGGMTLAEANETSGQRVRLDVVSEFE